MKKLRTMIKKSGFLTQLAYALRNIGISLQIKESFHNKIDPYSVVLFGLNSNYGDSPKAIAEYLHMYAPQYTLFWVIEKESMKEGLPSYLTPVVSGTKRYYDAIAAASAWITCRMLPAGFLKRDGQLYIQTWHGDKGFKKIVNDAEKDSADRKRETSGRKFAVPDYFLTGAGHFVPICRRAFGYNGEIIAKGLPRNDRLFAHEPEEIRTLKQKIGIAEEKKVLIYAPTFRDHLTSKETVFSNIDLLRILDVLREKDGNDWICLMRAHGGEKIRISGRCTEDERLIDVTTYPDMADLLLISDMLITDYSSCAGDFALTGKMVLIYQDDFDSYTQDDRTLYFRMEDSPYFTAKSQEQAEKIIRETDAEDIHKNAAEILKFYQVCETGHATEEVCSIILQNSRNLAKEQAR